jgi:hypothetical protein
LDRAIQLQIEEPAGTKIQATLYGARFVFWVLDVLQHQVPVCRMLEVVQRVGIFRRKPFLGFRALTVFKPAIVIHDFYAVVFIRYRMFHGNGSRRLSLGCGSKSCKQKRGQNCGPTIAE